MSCWRVDSTRTISLTLMCAAPSVEVTPTPHLLCFLAPTSLGAPRVCNVPLVASLSAKYDQSMRFPLCFDFDYDSLSSSHLVMALN